MSPKGSIVESYTPKIQGLIATFLVKCCRFCVKFIIYKNKNFNVDGWMCKNGEGWMHKNTPFYLHPTINEIFQVQKWKVILYLKNYIYESIPHQMHKNTPVLYIYIYIYIWWKVVNHLGQTDYVGSSNLILTGSILLWVRFTEPKLTRMRCRLG